MSTVFLRKFASHELKVMVCMCKLSPYSILVATSALRPISVLKFVVVPSSYWCLWMFFCAVARPVPLF